MYNPDELLDKDKKDTTAGGDVAQANGGDNTQQNIKEKMLKPFLNEGTATTSSGVSNSEQTNTNVRSTFLGFKIAGTHQTIPSTFLGFKIVDTHQTIAADTPIQAKKGMKADAGSKRSPEEIRRDEEAREKMLRQILVVEAITRDLSSKKSIWDKIRGDSGVEPIKGKMEKGERIITYAFDAIEHHNWQGEATNIFPLSAEALKLSETDKKNNAAKQKEIEAAFREIQEHVKIKFQRVYHIDEMNNADIRFFTGGWDKNSKVGTWLGRTHNSSEKRDIVMLQGGGTNELTIRHEIGHALGLSHDSDKTHDTITVVDTIMDVDGALLNRTPGFRVYDIAALQKIYGARKPIDPSRFPSTDKTKLSVDSAMKSWADILRTFQLSKGISQEDAAWLRNYDSKHPEAIAEWKEEEGKRKIYADILREKKLSDPNSFTENDRIVLWLYDSNHPQAESQWQKQRNKTKKQTEDKKTHPSTSVKQKKDLAVLCNYQ